MIEPQHRIEGAILVREFKARGFDCWKLADHALFRVAMQEYAECKLSFDDLVDIADKLAISMPSLKLPEERAGNE